MRLVDSGVDCHKTLRRCALRLGLHAGQLLLGQQHQWDQPIIVGVNVEFSGFHPVTCGFLPR